MWTTRGQTMDGQTGSNNKNLQGSLGKIQFSALSGNYLTEFELVFVSQSFVDGFRRLKLLNRFFLSHKYIQNKHTKVRGL